MTRTATPKPNKPYPEFPLFAHHNGQWAKKVLGKAYYFGTWDDPQGALSKFLEQRDYLLNGQSPPTQATTIADLLNRYLSDKKLSLADGRIKERTYREYVEVCDKIASTLHKKRPVNSLATEDFANLRNTLGIGAKGQAVAASTRKRLVGIARSVFKFANEELEFNLRYQRTLKPPTAKQMREAKNEKRDKLFLPEEIRTARDNAKPQLKAMVLLGINCGFINSDCGRLPIEALDLDSAWINYPRPKTAVPRRCPLWPETVDALKEVVGDRSSGLVFVTKYGNPWWVEGKQDPISYEFRKLATEHGFYRKGSTTFSALRTTFETVAEPAVSQAVIDCIMGHAADASDMGAVYRQKIFDSRLVECTEHVRKWVEGSVTLN